MLKYKFMKIIYRSISFQSVVVKQKEKSQALLMKTIESK